MQGFRPTLQFTMKVSETELDLAFKTIYRTKERIYHTGSNGTIFFSAKFKIVKPLCLSF